MENIFWVIIIAFAGQLVLFIINILKKNFTYPLVFKTLGYTITLVLQIIGYSLFTYLINYKGDDAITTYYVLATIAMYISHYILDEDYVYRFEKGATVSIVLVMTLLINVVWYYIFF